jgi:anti-sigma factor RsiW
MNCREFTEFLHEYLFGDLPAEERVEFEKHLAECPWCVAYLHSYRKTIQLEQAALAAPEDGPPPADAPAELVRGVHCALSRSSWLPPLRGERRASEEQPAHPQLFLLPNSL